MTTDFAAVHMVETLLPDISPVLPDPDGDTEFSCQKEGCGKPLTYSGRGRHPKFCDEHRGSSSGAGTRQRRQSLAPRLENAFMALGLGLSMVNQQDATIIAQNANNMAVAWDALANENPKIRRALERALSASAWGGVLAASLPVIMGIGMNHGLIPNLFPAQSQEPATE